MNNYLKILCLSLSAILVENSSFAAVNFPDDLKPFIEPKKIKLIRALNLIDDAEQQGLINRLGKNRQHAFSILLEKVSPTNKVDDTESLQGMIEIIMDLPSFDPNMSCGPNSTILIQAISSKDDGFKYHRIEKLLKLKADPNRPSKVGTPLYVAVSLNDLRSVKLLLKYKANVNVGASAGGPIPVKLAAERGYLDIIKVLLEHGAISKIHSQIHEENFIKANLLTYLTSSLVDITMSYLPRPPQLSLGRFHSCAINSSSKLLCWAHRSLYEAIVPDELKDDQVRKVAVGDGKACAINSGGKLVCWEMDRGEKISLPDELKNGVQEVSTKGCSACAISSIGKLVCWEMVRGKKISLPNELKNDQVLKVSIGNYVCAINNVGKLVCFDTIGSRSSFSPDVLKNERIEQVSVGDGHACAINSAQKLFCWGNNNYGQTYIPNELKNDQVKQVAVGNIFTCATNKDGQLYCWGGLNWGQKYMPDELIRSRVEQISAGSSFVCANNTEGQLFCWGTDAPMRMP